MMSVLYDDVQMDKFWNLCGHYQDIYYWIISRWINSQAYHLF